MFKFFREPNVDYMRVDMTSGVSSRVHAAHLVVLYDCLACADEGNPDSVFETGVSSEYLSECTEVKQSDLPLKWSVAL